MGEPTDESQGPAPSPRGDERVGTLPCAAVRSASDLAVKWRRTLPVSQRVPAAPASGPVLGPLARRLESPATLGVPGIGVLRPGAGPTRLEPRRSRGASRGARDRVVGADGLRRGREQREALAGRPPGGPSLRGVTRVLAPDIGV